jgi:Tol biopolymer transport system component
MARRSPSKLQPGTFRHPAWSTDGRRILCAAGADLADTTIVEVPATVSGKLKKLAWAGDGNAPAISRRGRRLAFTRTSYRFQTWRVDLPVGGRKESPPVLVGESTRGDFGAQYSPDGKRMAFISTRSGNREIWTSAIDGSSPAQVTALGSWIGNLRWSPDGQSITFYATAEGGNHEIFTVRAGGGKSRRLTDHPAADRAPFWSGDGRWIYFSSDRAGRGRTWKIPQGGGEPLPLTPVSTPWGWGPHESPDGRFLYHERPSGPGSNSVWRVTGSGSGKQEKVLDGVFRSNWEVVEQGIYFVPAPSEDGRYSIRFLDLRTGKVRQVVGLTGQPGWVLSVSPTADSILYSQFDMCAADLMLVENYR